MSSGLPRGAKGSQPRDQRQDPPGAGRGGRPQRDHLGSAAAMAKLRAADARAPLGGARAGALAAMEAAPSVAHRRLAAAAAGSCPGAATRGREEVARRVAVVEPAAAMPWQQRRIRRLIARHGPSLPVDAAEDIRYTRIFVNPNCVTRSVAVAARGHIQMAVQLT